MSSNSAVQSAPYGTWKSPITADLIAKKAVSYDDVLVDPITSDIYHIEKRPNEGGRNVIVDSQTGQDLFGKDWNARTGVHEYGGASAYAYGGVVYFSHFADGRVYKVEKGSEPVAVTPENPAYRYANFVAVPKYPHILISILEDHTHPAPSEVVTTLVSINTQNTTIEPFVSGADFYASPKFNADGSLVAWTQWSHPDMPWEGSTVYVAKVSVNNGKVKAANAKKIAGEKETVSATQPNWTPNGALLFLSDISGFVNPWKAEISSSLDVSAKPILKSALEEDFAEPDWVLGNSSYVILDDNTLLCTAFKEGRSVIYIVSLDAGRAVLASSPYVYITNVRRISGNKVIFFGTQGDAPKAIVLASLGSGAGDVSLSHIVAPKEEDEPIPKTYFSPPQPISFQISPGEPLHVVFHAPTNPEYVGPVGEKPPCVVSIHGGPTSMATQGLSLRQQYFTSRGFAWVDVNYGGSSGYGRKYIERLVGKWGITDVVDAVQSVTELSKSGLIDGKRAAITGGSAGGYTVLASLACIAPGTPSDAFAAGTSSYGVSDLRKLAEFTHKFESRYLDKLVGGTPDEVPEVYKERSPVFHADRIKTPLLILQGAIDAVVPPAQAEDMVKVIQEHGGYVEYKLYDGEGHGWRKAETIIDALERELAFYQKVLKL